MFCEKYNLLKKYIDVHKDNINKLIKWMKENTYSPTYTPSQTTVLYKKKIINYEKVSITQLQYQNCKFVYINIYY